MPHTKLSMYIVLGFSRGNSSVSHHNANTVVKLKHITRYHCVKIKGVILRQVCYTQSIFHQNRLAQGFSTFSCSWPTKMIQYDGGPTTFAKRYKVKVIT